MIELSLEELYYYYFYSFIASKYTEFLDYPNNFIFLIDSQTVLQPLIWRESLN